MEHLGRRSSTKFEIDKNQWEKRRESLERMQATENPPNSLKFKTMKRIAVRRTRLRRKSLWRVGRPGPESFTARRGKGGCIKDVLGRPMQEKKPVSSRICRQGQGGVKPRIFSQGKRRKIADLLGDIPDNRGESESRQDGRELIRT